MHIPRAPDIFPGGNKTAMSYFQVPLSQRLSWANSRDIISTCEIKSTRQQKLFLSLNKALKREAGVTSGTPASRCQQDKPLEPRRRGIFTCRVDESKPKN